MFAWFNRKTIAGGSAVAVAASLALVWTALVPEAKAEVAVERMLPQAIPSAAMGSACSARSWPNYDQNCQFDLRSSADEARAVRVIALR